MLLGLIRQQITSTHRWKRFYLADPIHGKLTWVGHFDARLSFLENLIVYKVGNIFGIHFNSFESSSNDMRCNTIPSHLC